MVEVIKRDSDRLDQLIDPAVEAIRNLFKEVDPDEKDFAVANIAKGVLATWAKLKQTESATDALRFTMAKELMDKDKLAEYVALTLPGKQVKQLEKGKGE